MIVLLYLLIATLGSTATVLLVKDVRAKRAVRALAAPAPDYVTPHLTDDEITQEMRDRSLARVPRAPGGDVCRHLERPVAATTTDLVAGPTVVGWLCPTCLADRPEPKPMTCAPMPAGYDGKWHDEPATTTGVISATRITAGSIRADRITLAPTMRNIIEPGWGWVTVQRGTRDVPLSDNPADWDRADADAAVHACRGLVKNPDYEVSYQAATRLETARARQRELDPVEPEPEDVYEVRSHASDVPVRTFTTPERSPAPTDRLRQAYADTQAHIGALLDSVETDDKGNVILSVEDVQRVETAVEHASHLRKELLAAADLPTPILAGGTSITYANHQAEQHERNVFALALEERLIASGVMAPVTDFVTFSDDPHRGALGRGWPADSPYAPI